MSSFVGNNHFASECGRGDIVVVECAGLVDYEWVAVFRFDGAKIVELVWNLRAW